MNINPRCPICEKETETITHIFLQCDLAKQVCDKWDGCPINLTASHFDFTDIATQFLNNGAANDLEMFL